MYILLFIYSDMNFNIIIIVCDIQSSYPVNMDFNLPALFGRLVTEFEYCYVVWSIEEGAAYRIALTDISCTLVKYLHMVTWV